MSRGGYGPRPQGPGRQMDGRGRGMGAGGPGPRRPPPGGPMEDLSARMESLGGFTRNARGEREVHVVTNHFEVSSILPTRDVEAALEKPQLEIHQFHLDFSDKSVGLHIRKRVLKANQDTMFQGAFVYDGGEQMYCVKKFTSEHVLIPEKLEENTPKVKVTYTKTLAATDPVCLSIYNLIVKQCMYALTLTPLGDSFFDPAAVIDFPKLKVQLWPGYTASVKPCESGLLLCVDMTHKVIHSNDLLTNIRNITEMYEKQRNKDKSLDLFIQEKLNGYVVITPYNKKSYRLDGLRTDMTPLSSFGLKNGGEISFQEYYKMRYNVEIVDLTQPLVVSHVKEKGQEMEVILIPELCTLTGLSEEMKNNFTAMTELGKHLHLSPSERVKKVKDFMKRLTSSPSVRDIMKKWGIVVDSNLARCINAKVFPNVGIEFAGKKTFPADDKNDWTKALRGHKMLSSVPLKDWMVITPERDSKLANEFVQTMVRVAEPLGFEISQPFHMEKLRDARTFSYLRVIEEKTISQQKKPQLIMCVLPNNGADLYNSIKYRLTGEIGIPSQCIVAKTLTKNMMSVATKVVVQMNTKLGGEPWKMQNLPRELRESTMTIGFDYSGKKQKTGVLVATTNADCTRYCSVTFAYNQASELNGKLKEGIAKCVVSYMKENDSMPSTVVFYRNNVDDGRIDSGEIEADAKQLEQTLQYLWKAKNAEEVKLVYVTLAKGSTTRLMSHTGSCTGPNRLEHNQIVNPPPGTVVDKDIVSMDRKYKEFFLVPTVARQGTVRAVHYRVILDTKGLSPKDIQGFTYKLCHLYYNWTGTVNLPSVIQYAGKLGKQTAPLMPKFIPHEQLAELLHFL